MAKKRVPGAGARSLGVVLGGQESVQGIFGGSDLAPKVPPLMIAVCSGLCGHAQTAVRLVGRSLGVALGGQGVTGIRGENDLAPKVPPLMMAVCPGL
jgi:hypothetical protein